MARYTTQADSGAVDRRGDDLLQGSELLRDAGLEIERELELGESRHALTQSPEDRLPIDIGSGIRVMLQPHSPPCQVTHRANVTGVNDDKSAIGQWDTHIGVNCRQHLFTVLSGSGAGAGGNLSGPESLRSKSSPGNDTPGHMLEGRPVLSIEERFVTQPIGNRLLTDGRAIEELGEPFGKGSLATGNLDSLFQRSDVGVVGNIIFIHEHRLYKHACETVNKPACVTEHKDACKVVEMPVHKTKIPTRQKRPRKQEPEFDKGVDGRTTNERFRIALRAKGAAYREADLVKDCNAIAGMGANDKDYVSQQMLNQMRKGQVDASKSQFLPVIAEALSVRAVWLVRGVEPMQDPRLKLLDELLKLDSKKG